ncbi:MAG TPA: AAA family ATPase [Planctomycetota bacterium]|nr:AAA family ATPase [Planctomycetota bacterium]
MTRWEEAARKIQEELRKRIVGMDDVIEKMLICIFTRNHALLVGVPGLAKTLLISSLAEALDLTFARIQFTPDLMPSDITGTEVLAEDREKGTRTFRFLPGPVFANIVLADEINRTPPKTQAALMEAMEERQVTSVGKRYPLPEPFFVLATQNPIEQEGTYPLPAAQLDRFMFRIRIEYPEADDERRIARRTTRPSPQRATPVLGAKDVAEFGLEVAKVDLPKDLEEKIVSLVRRTRPDEPSAPAFIREWIAFGASPRAAQALGVACRARALLHGRTAVRLDDVLALAPDIVRHRLVLNYHATAEGVRAVGIVRKLLADHFDLAPKQETARPLWRRLLRLG